MVYRVGYKPRLIPDPATVVADIVAHLPPNTISGAVYLGAVPHTGMGKRVIPAPVLEVIYSFQRDGDVSTFVSNKMPFIDGCFAHADQFSHELRSLWAGITLASTPIDLKNAFNRPQDPTALLKVAREGSLPLLVLHGKLDVIVDAKSVVQELDAMPWKGAEVVILEGAGHAPFHESTESVMQHIAQFAKRVQPKRHAAKL